VIISSAFYGKRFAILGLARSGLAAAETLLASGAQVVAWDRQDNARAALEGRASLADPLEIDLHGFDAVVVSPGVPLNTHPIAEYARMQGVPVIGDIELFALARAALPPHRVIGITGTNGKSTTTALVHHLFRSAGVPSLMGGNIGLPILAQEPLAPNANGLGVYVLELSSYQLDLTFSLRCEAAGLTNITPDHLDRHGTFEAYAESKARLFEMQDPAQFAVFGCADPPTIEVCKRAIAQREGDRVACVDKDALVPFQPNWPSLQGPHNLENAAIAAALVEELGLTRAQVLSGLASFTGLAHRMERLGIFGGVLFINDSKATNPASTAPALAAFPPAPDRRIHWILGGLPKGDGLGECEQFFGNVAAAYTIGEAGPHFADLLEPHTRVERCELLSEAVARAMRAAQPGEVVLFSPSCASFDQFRDYEMRGDAFREIVAALAGEAAGPPLEAGRSAA
jgi:UDP-N-acetylmuramoylalanine--D-glutamate ligase